MRWIQHPITNKLIPADEYVRPSKASSAMIIPDIEPYRSIATADAPIITSRSKEREYMKERGLVKTEDLKGLKPRLSSYEITPEQLRPGIRQELIKQLYK